MRTRAPHRTLHRLRQRGSAVIIVLGLMVIVLAYVGFNAATLHGLGRTVQRLEYKQLRRLEAAGLSTNAAATFRPSSPSKAPAPQNESGKQP